MLDGEVAPSRSRGFPGGSEDGRSSLEEDRPRPRGVRESGLAPGFRVPGCVPHLAGPGVDNQGVHVGDGDSGGRDFQPGETPGPPAGPGVRDGETSPRWRRPTGTPPGALGRTLTVRWTCWLGGVSGGDSRGSRKVWGHPDNGRSILFRTQCSGSRWALGGHPETSAHPHGERPRFREVGTLWAGNGLVGEKTQFACGTGSSDDGKAVPGEYSGARLPALHYVVSPRYSDGESAGIFR